MGVMRLRSRAGEVAPLLLELAPGCESSWLSECARSGASLREGADIHLQGVQPFGLSRSCRACSPTCTGGQCMFYALPKAGSYE